MKALQGEWKSKAIAQSIRECGGTQSLYLLIELVFFLLGGCNSLTIQYCARNKCNKNRYWNTITLKANERSIVHRFCAISMIPLPCYMLSVHFHRACFYYSFISIAIDAVFLRWWISHQPRQRYYYKCFATEYVKCEQTPCFDQRIEPSFVFITHTLKSHFEFFYYCLWYRLVTYRTNDQSKAKSGYVGENCDFFFARTETNSWYLNLNDWRCCSTALCCFLKMWKLNRALY